MLKGTTTSAALAAAALAALLSSGGARAEDLVVQYDQARLLVLSEPAANIIVGNPSIADVTLKSTKLLVVTGKTFGVTNLMILNDDEKVIFNSRVMVKADDTKVVSLNRGGSIETYNCLPKCEPVLKVGDEAKHYQGIAQAAQQKMKLSEGNTDNTQAGN